MNIITSPRIKGGIKKIKNIIIIGIILIIIAIISAIWGYNSFKTETNPIYLDDLIVEGTTENTYSEVEVASIPYLFAGYEDTTDSFYIIYDTENLMYIVYMTEETFNTLNRDDIETNPAILSGISEKTPDWLKEYAVEAYNEAVEEEFLNESNFENYLGGIYLDTTQEPEISSLPIAITIFSGAIGITLFITGIINYNNTRKKIKNYDSQEWEQLEREVESESTICYKNPNVILTENYIINLNGQLEIIPYSDIIWMNKFSMRYKMQKTTYISFITKDKKHHTLTEIKNELIKSQPKHNEIIDHIQEKNKNILFGVTPEIKKEMKEKYNIKVKQ